MTSNIECQFFIYFFSDSVTNEEMSQPVQETEHDANEESELVLPQGVFHMSYYYVF